VTPKEEDYVEYSSLFKLKYWVTSTGHISREVPGLSRGKEDKGWFSPPASSYHQVANELELLCLPRHVMV